MKNQLSGLSELRLHYPNAEYESGQIFNGDDVIESDGNLLIEEHYNGMEATFAHESGDPTREYPKTVSGKEYIEQMFDGDYNEAFLNG